MKAINKILLLTDFSELANNATQYALNIAKSKGLYFSAKTK